MRNQPVPMRDELLRLAERDQIKAWFAVCDLLTEICPGWALGNGTGAELALRTIRALAERADRPNKPPCTYPDCKCPFDAPADPNWCALGYKKAERAGGAQHGAQGDWRTLDRPLLEVLLMQDMPPLVVAAHGRIAQVIESVERDLEENPPPEFESMGDGLYVFRASYFEGQYGEYGRCEFEPGWELDFVSYQPLEETQPNTPQPSQPANNDIGPCDPNATNHGFDRTASLSLGTYVCECGGNGEPANNERGEG